MNQENANSKSIIDLSLPQAAHDARCQHRFVNGTRCRLPVPNPESLFCRNHAHLPEHENAPADFSAILTAGLTEFKSAIPINDFLSRLLHLEAADRIHPRRAAVMAYTCNLLLRTLPAIEDELHPEGEIAQVDFGNFTRPLR
jgi:hypothetical protein